MSHQDPQNKEEASSGESPSQDKGPEEGTGESLSFSSSKSMQADATSPRGTGFILSVFGLLVGFCALTGLLYFAPGLNSRMDALDFEVKNATQSVQLLEQKIHNLGDNMTDLTHRLSDVEKNRTIKELKKMLETLEAISKNVPEASLQKTDSIKESILSILTDLGISAAGFEATSQGENPEEAIQGESNQEPEEAAKEEPKQETENSKGATEAISLGTTGPSTETSPETSTEAPGGEISGSDEGQKANPNRMDAGEAKKEFGDIELKQE